MYPFVPKSTARMKSGQFWGVPLSGQCFGCGVVLSIEKKANGQRDKRRFLAGLLDWTGRDKPSQAEISGRRVIAHGFADLKTVTENGGSLLGEVQPWWHWPPELENLDNTPTWGYRVISMLAEKHRKSNSEPGAAPNGGPPTQLGNSESRRGRHR
jgi:hypothetical protein